MSETENTTNSDILYFEQALINNSQGITITDGMVKEVANPFLDLSSIITGESKFYFLADDDTHYDQIVLENLYNTLNSIASCEVLKSDDQTELVSLMIKLLFNGRSVLTTLKGDEIKSNDQDLKKITSSDELISFLEENFVFGINEIETYFNAAFTRNDTDSIKSLCSFLKEKYGVSDNFIYDTLIEIFDNILPEDVYLEYPCNELDENGKVVKIYTNDEGTSFELYYDSTKGYYCTKKDNGSFDKTIYDILGLTKEKFVKYGNYYAMYEIDGVTYNYGSSDSTGDEVAHKYTSSNGEALLIFSSGDSLNGVGSSGIVGKYPKKITYDGVIYDLQTTGEEENLVPDKSNDGTCVRYKNGDTVILVSILSDVDTKKKSETEEYNGRSALFDEKNNGYTWSNDEQTYIDKNGDTIYEHFGVENKTLTEISGVELFKKIFTYDNGNPLSDNDAELAYKAWWQGKNMSEITLSGGKKLELKSGSDLKDDENPEYWGINFDNDAKQAYKAWQISQITSKQKTIEDNDYYSSVFGKIIEKIESKIGLGTDEKESSEVVENFMKNYTKLVLEELDNDSEGKYKSLTDAIEKEQDNLLNLCLLSSCPRTETTNSKIGYDEINHEIIAPMDRKVKYSGTYCLASGVKRITNPDGSYSYKIVKASGEEGKISADELKDSFSKVNAIAGTNADGIVTSTISWYAMTIMYEKVAVQQMVLAEQLNQIEEKNEKIRENNKMLSALSTLYNQMYEVFGKDCGDKKNGGSWETVELKEKKLKEYLTDTVKASIDCNYVKFTDIKIDGKVYEGACCKFQHSTFNKSGEKEKDKGGQTDNIDVHEQAAINMVSMWQDQVRMYGDELSTDAQLMTTKMEQYIQNVNSSLTTCTQTVKAVEDLCKAITQNIR